MPDSDTKYRVLCVDDEETVRQFLQQALDRRGHVTVMAENGQQALDILEKETFDVLLTDLYMPVVDGLELIRQSKAKHPEMVSIILTGLGTTRDSIAAIKEGVYDYIEKPVRDINAFLMAIDRAGARARLVKERDELFEDLQEKNAKLEKNLRNLNAAYDHLMRQEEALEADLRQAQRMQQSLLPSGFPEIEGLDFFGYYRPCERLGGDFFDVIPLSDGRAAVYVADVAGHGVLAAMVTVIIRELIHAERTLHRDDETFADPVRALAFLNGALLEEELDHPLHTTMAYAVVDGRTGDVTYASAGHPRPIVRRVSGRAEPIEVHGPALGMDVSPTYANVKTRLEPGETMLIYSDGLSEARNAAGEELSATALIDVMSSGGDHWAADVGDRLERALVDHQQGATLPDDATFVVVCRNGRSRGEPRPDRKTVRIVNVGAIRAPKPQLEAHVESGQSKTDFVIRLVGPATWQQGPALRTLIERSKARGFERCHVDLKRCQSLDSTLMGILNQYSNRVILAQPADKPRDQLEEVGILPHLQVLEEPPPIVETKVEPQEAIERAEKARMILTAHESLIAAVPENRPKFQAVADLMRRDIEEQEQTPEKK